MVHEKEKEKKERGKTAKTKEHMIDARTWAEDIKELTEGIEKKAVYLDEKQYMSYLKALKNLEKILA